MIDVDDNEVASLLTLKEGDFPGLSRWSQYNHKDPGKWEQEAKELVSE